MLIRLNGMKQLLIFLLFCFCLSNSAVYAQTYELKKTPDRLDLLDRIKELFEVSPELTYNFSKDPMVSFDSLEKPVVYDQEYYEMTRLELKKNPENSVVLNNLANYYNFHGKLDSAEMYFKRSKEFLTFGSVENDTAFFYSFRGILKLNLKEEDAINDIEKALEFNPKDSLAMAFYPFLLLQKGDYKKANTICKKALNEGIENPLFPYVVLIVSGVFEDYFGVARQVLEDSELKARYRKMDYIKIMNYNVLDKYVKHYSDKHEIQNARHMADILGLMMKLLFFEQDENGIPQLAYTKYEKKKFKEIEAWLIRAEKENTMNTFAVQKNLGFIYLFQQKWDLAIPHLKEAIQKFPKEQRDQHFSTNDLYNALLSIYVVRDQMVSAEELLKTKIEVEPEGRKSALDMQLLAYINFLNNDLSGAEKWAAESKSVDRRNFNVLRLLAHIYYVKEYTSLAEMYIAKAVKYMQSDYDQYVLAIQLAAYYLVAEQPAEVYRYIGIARKYSTDGECGLCDEFEEEFILIKH